MKIQFFKSVSEAMQYIIANKLTASLAQTEQTLLSKSIVKVKDVTILVDSLGILD